MGRYHLSLIYLKKFRPKKNFQKTLIKFGKLKKFTYLCVKMIIAYIDGSCYPANPGGRMGIGIYLNINDIIHTHKQHYGRQQNNTNNLAEYLALKKLLEMCSMFSGETVVINADSLMLINQMIGKNKINRGKYKTTALDCKKLLKEIEKYNTVVFNWIPREQNTEADDLSKT